MSEVIRLTADFVARVVLQEAEAAGTTPGRVLSMATDGNASAARRRAFQRLARETGASAKQIARIWGCDPSGIARHLRSEDIGSPGSRWPDTIRPASEHAPSVAAAVTTFAAIDRLRGIA